MQTPISEFLLERLPELWLRLGQHLVLTGVSTGMAIAIGVPLGVIAIRSHAAKGVILAIVAVLQTIPSLALLTLLLALLGKIGALPAVIALTLYALLPIVRNTITGLEAVSDDALMAAQGLGMTRWQQLRIVQFPLALPVVLAGVRTAAVIGVGVATLSAFIGAGGLGEFINRGLALDNTRLILLGAIPSALLALVVDGALAAVGWAVDPMRKRDSGQTRVYLVRALALLTPFLILGFGTAGYFRARPDVVVASKAFSESILLGHMMADLIEHRTDLTVERRLCLGGTMICHGALTSGEVDLYAEYTGTSLTAVLHQPAVSDPQAVYDKVSGLYKQQFDLAMLAPFGLNNTYAIAVRRTDAEIRGWRRISDLVDEADQLRAGWTAEFSERPDGYNGLKETYGLQFGRVVDIEAGAMYKAIRAGEVDVIAAYSTDGRIAAYDLVLLEDDAAYFPPYYAAPVVRQDTLELHPQIADVLAPLAGKLTSVVMRDLNYRVDELKQNPRIVAREFLIAEGLLSDE